jgi:large subunit ribosomal protein L31e
MADKITDLERIYTIPLRKAKDLTRSRRADNAVRDVKRYLTRHMKSDNVWLDQTVNEALWSNGKYSIPSRIRVKATRFSDGVVEVTLPESTATGSIRDSIQTRRETAATAPVLKAPEPEASEAEGDAARPVTDVKGIGPATAEKLEKAGITNLQELADSDPAKVMEIAAVSDEKAKHYVADAKAILSGKTDVADVKAQPALEAAKEEAEKPKAGADERAHLEAAGKSKAAKKDE